MAPKEVRIEIVKHGNAGFSARISMNDLVLTSNPIGSRFTLRLSLKELCKHLGEGNFTIIDEGSPRFEDDQKRVSEGEWLLPGLREEKD